MCLLAFVVLVFGGDVFGKRSQPGSQTMEQLHSECITFLKARGVWKTQGWQRIISDPMAAVQACVEQARLDRVSPMPFHPLPGNEVAGPLKLGVVPVTGMVAGLNLRELVTGGLCCLGVRGSGKTTLEKTLLMQLPCSYTVFDPAGEFADLALIDPSCAVVDVKDISVTPFIHNTPRPHDARAFGLNGCVTFASVESLLTASLSQIEDLYLSTARRLCTYQVPFEEVLREAFLRKVPFGPEGQYLTRVRNRLKHFLNEMPGCITGNKSFVPHLLRNRVIIRGTFPSSESKRFFVISILNALLAHRALHPPQDAMDIHAIVCPEAHIYFGREQEVSAEAGRAAFSQPFLDSRKVGFVFAWDSQSPSMFSRIILSNTPNIVAFRHQDAKDLAELRSTLNLTPEQVWWLNELPRWTGLFRTPAFPGAFPIRTIPLPRVDVSEVFLKQRKNEFFKSINWTPSLITDVAINPEVYAASSKGTSPSGKAQHEKPRQDAPKQAVPKGRELDLVRSSCQHAFSFVSEHQHFLGWGGATTTSAVKGLKVFSEYVVFVEVQCGKKGHPPTWIQAQEKAYSLCGIALPKWFGRLRQGKGIHYCVQQRVGRHFRNQGAKVSIEREIHGKRVDVIIEFPSKPLLAVEIQLTPDTTHTNIPKNYEAGLREQLVLFSNRKSLERTREACMNRLPKQILEGVKWDVLGHYLWPTKKGSKS